MLHICLFYHDACVLRSELILRKGKAPCGRVVWFQHWTALEVLPVSPPSKLLTKKPSTVSIFTHSE